MSLGVVRLMFLRQSPAETLHRMRDALAAARGPAPPAKAELDEGLGALRVAAVCVLGWGGF